jgi:pilus assembly protein Flp/PilA
VAKVQEHFNRKNVKNHKKPIPQKGEKQMERIKNFFKDESGASAVEYGLLVALIAVVIIGAVTALGTGVQNTFNTAAGQLGG